ncbi:MAG TPA: sulfotransferase [Phycisphaerales bacterium]|nr:sulfotransferase [Phycisphaerales bacterium]
MRQGNPGVRTELLRAEESLRQGDAAAAVAQCRRHLRRDPTSVRALDLLYRAQLATGEREAALYSLESLIRLAPQEIGYRRQLALVHKQDRRFADAHAALDRALELAPSDAPARSAKAELLFLEGEFAAAAAVLGPCLEGDRVHPAAAQTYARLAPRLDARERAVELLRRSLGAPEPDQTKSRLLFELGHLLDALGRYDEAFAAYREANQLKIVPGDPDAYRRAVEQMLRSWDRAACGEADVTGGAAVVFIVGMPRSGTSLVEQMLASHPRIVGGGERTDMELIVRELIGPDYCMPNILASPAALPAGSAARLRARYGATLARAAGEGMLLTDKAPFNFMHLGLIQRICPGARVIHCTRDPLDTCLSIYFNNLVGGHVPPPDLRSIGERHRLYERVMAHWRGVLSLPILDVAYEDLIADLGGWGRRMLEFLGLPWDDAVLRYHESRRVTLTPSADQVRRPIYSSSRGRWRHYEPHLGELRAGLGAGAGPAGS